MAGINWSSSELGSRWSTDQLADGLHEMTLCPCGSLRGSSRVFYQVFNLDVPAAIAVCTELTCFGRLVQASLSEVRCILAYQAEASKRVAVTFKGRM